MDMGLAENEVDVVIGNGPLLIKGHINFEAYLDAVIYALINDVILLLIYYHIS